jgi:hypothetical protein
MTVQHSDNRVDDQLRKLWQAQQLEGEKMSLEEVRSRAGAFERRIRGRNIIEYAGALAVLAANAKQVFFPTPENVMTRISAALIIMGTMYVVYTLRTRGSAKQIPDALARASFIEFYRSSLENHRDLLQNAWRWYLLPFLPGILTILVSFAIRDGLLFSATPSPHRLRDGLFLLLFMVGVTLFLFFIARWNRRTARKLQSEIDFLTHNQ